jgi:hypothetical protein
MIQLPEFKGLSQTNFLTAGGDMSPCTSTDERRMTPQLNKRWRLLSNRLPLYYNDNYLFNPIEHISASSKHSGPVNPNRAVHPNTQYDTEGPLESHCVPVSPTMPLMGHPVHLVLPRGPLIPSTCPIPGTFPPLGSPWERHRI